MKISLNKQSTHTILTLEQENLNSLIAPDLKSEFVFLRNEGVRYLIFNMNHIRYVDSSGLSAILTANRLWSGYGSFILTGVVHPTVKKLIEISKLDSILTILPSEQEAIEYAMIERIEKELSEGDVEEE